MNSQTSERSLLRPGLQFNTLQVGKIALTTNRLCSDCKDYCGMDGRGCIGIHSDMQIFGTRFGNHYNQNYIVFGFSAMSVLTACLEMLLQERSTWKSFSMIKRTKQPSKQICSWSTVFGCVIRMLCANVNARFVKQQWLFNNENVL